MKRTMLSGFATLLLLPLISIEVSKFQIHPSSNLLLIGGRYMNMKMLSAVALLLACALGLFQGGSAQAQRNLTAQRNPTGAKELPVEVRSTSGIVTLEKASIIFDKEFRILKLFVSNKSSQPVNRLQYSYTIYEPDGKVRGGGNRIQKVELPASSPIEQWTLLHSEVEPNDRVVLMFEGSSNK